MSNKYNVVTMQAQAQVIPCFAPKEIRTGVSSVTSDGTVVAIRSTSSFSYSLDGITFITNEAGAILGVSPAIEAITFASPVALLEVM